MAENDIQKGLEHESQRLLERVPKNANRDNTRHIVESLKTLMADHKIAQAEIGRWVGYSATTISEFISGRYRGDYAKIANKIVNVLNGFRRKEQAQKDRRPFVDTSIALAIKELITRVQSFSDDEGTIGLIVGDGGHGKSCCLREYSKADLNSVFVELDNTMGSVQIFAAIAKGLGLDSTGSLPVLAERLIETLRHRHLTVLLDEASSLKVKQLNQLRQIIVVKGKCPLVLAGNQHLLNTVMQPSTMRGCESLDQFTSRMVGTLNLDEMATDKDGGLYTPDDIRKLYEYGGVRLTTDGVDALRRIGRTPQSGRFRTCNIIITSLHASGVVFNKGYIDSRLIIAAISQINLPVKDRLPLAVLREITGSEKAETAVVAG